LSVGTRAKARLGPMRAFFFKMLVPCYVQLIRSNIGGKQLYLERSGIAGEEREIFWFHVALFTYCDTTKILLTGLLFLQLQLPVFVLY
jgi:hypothetical protein